ncbi:putative nuclease HARBI1 [Eublepharis macularius]|uniref:Nuclease HARBI1 n=1 Tax=Eublepharis macularius TaxID=481883 RepID=A0AA97JVR4_EUBMA|nr:putative nuclease HARBI1 [Eublepharis macularius]
MHLHAAYLRRVLRRRKHYVMFREEMSHRQKRRQMLASRRRRFQRELWLALAEEHVPRKCWVTAKSQDWWDRIVLCTWDDEEWIECFRMTRATFEYLVRILRPRLERQKTKFRDPITVEKRVAVAIWCLATGSCYRQAKDQFGIGVSTAGTAFLEVCYALEAELLCKTVCLGTAVGTVMDGFSALGFPHCVGAIDGSHIPICAPGGSPEQYGNRKNFSSILLQGTVDHRGRFIDTEIGWSGKNHDAFVLRNSAICAAMDAGTFVPGNPCLHLDGVTVPPIVISDGAYPIRRWLMKPYGTHAETEAHRNFNRALSRARNVVERSFGRLKSRFRCLATRLNCREENVVTVVSACVILHNICEERGHQLLGDRGDPRPVMVPPEEDAVLEQDRSHLEEGKIVRDALSKFMYNNNSRI